MQNYLLFIALTHLDAMTFQMLSQSKLISAAIFSVVLLDKHLRMAQWVSLALLTFGVYLSQGHSKAATPIGNVTSSSQQSAVATETPTHSNSSSHITEPQGIFGGTVVIGAVACILSGISSSFAGVYFEKVVKTTPPSLAVRNIHLSMFAIPLAVLSMLIIDVLPPLMQSSDALKGARLKPFSFWRGYNWLTISLVFVHALGGLLVAVVVKYADNILKGFATAIAIVVSGVYMMLFWSYTPSLWFIIGCSLVCASTIAYQVYEPKKGSGGKKLTGSRAV